MRRLTISGRTLSVALFALPCAFGYIGETLISGGQTIQVTHPDAASLQFYLNNFVVAGATSSLAGSASPVITASSNPSIAIEAAMASWNNIGSASIHFNALLPTTVGHSASDCLNVISIAASASDLSVLGFVSASSPGVVAVTANAIITSAGNVCGGAVNAGAIVDSDILMNPYIPFSTDNTSKTQDVQAVFTHEFGHVFGMNHSGLLGATMYPYAATHERHQSWDEKAFAATYYPSGPKTLGTISGTVTLGASPVVYGLVVLTDVSTGGGKVVGGLTGTDGSYSVQVPPGTYNVYAEPFNSFIGPTNIYSLSTSNGVLNSALATTGFQATFSGGNTTSPPVFVVTAGSASTANISVISGATPLATPFYAVGKAGANGDIASFSGSGAISLTGGQSFDVAFTGPGIDTSVTVAFIGTNVTVVGSPRVDSSGETVNGQPVIRQTLTIGSQTNVTMGTLWIIKGTNYLPFSGILDIEPMVPTVSNVLDAESFRASFASGQYVAIYGNNLSGDTKPGWSTSTDFTGGTAAGDPLPTVLDGVSVTVNSVPAAVYSVCGTCSPNQINIIAPSNLTPGPATVVVSNQATASAAFTTSTIALSAPSFFEYFAGSNYYPAAVHLNAPTVLVGDPAVQSGAAKALPGETLIMFGNGLGPELGGVVTAGVGFAGPITITGTSGSNSFTATSVAAALVYAGEFQINVTLPASIPSGNYALTMTVPNGSTSTSGLTMILPVGP